MNYTRFTLLILIIFYGCGIRDQKTPSLICNNNIVIQYDKKIKNNYPEINNPEILTVYFLSEIDDDLKAYVNDSLYFDDYVNTLSSSDDLKYHFTFHYIDHRPSKILKIVTTKNGCFDFKVDPEYNFIYVFLTDKKQWIIRYSNNYYGI